jgi:hypothetical protein
LDIPRRDSVLFAVTAAVIVAAFALSTGQPPAGSRTTTTTSGQESAFVTSADGLRLTLQLSGTTIRAGGSVTINVTESNPLTAPANISATTDWPLQGLRMSACYASVYPFAVAVFQGHYASGNVSTAKPLNLFPFMPCPLLIRYISGYYFEPDSELAVVLPGSGSPISMAAGVAAAGNYTAGNALVRFVSGQYTVVAGDEWGAMVFLYFEVV